MGDPRTAETNRIPQYPVIRRIGVVLLVLLAWSPALFMLRLILRCGVDVPYADEWALAPFFLKAHQHSLTLLDFFTQHNEHRYFLPKVLLLVIAPLSSGNLKAEMIFSFVLTLLASGGIWYLLSRTVETSLPKRLLLLGLLNLVLFSPVQAENWTWGYQFVLFLNNTLLVVGVAVAISRRSLLARFVIGVVIAFSATFSFGGGVILWVVTFPIALVAETRLAAKAKYLWLSAWVCLAAMAEGLYFYGYQKPTHHPPVFASTHPTDYLLYIATFLGAHLSRADRTQSIVVAVFFGTLLLSLYFAGFLWVVRSGAANFRTKMLPWLAIGAAALLSAVLAAAARIGFGVNQGLDSRYTTFSLCISVSVIGMFAVAMTIYSHEVYRSPVNGFRWFGTAWLLTAFPTLFLIGHLNAAWWGAGSMKQTRLNRRHGKAALLFTNVVDAAGAVHARYLIANVPQTREFANIENSLGFIHPPLLPTAEIRHLKSSERLAGIFQSLIADGSSYEAKGWAIVPHGNRAADGVVLAYDDPAKGPIAFAVAEEMVARPDVVEALHDARLEYAGWVCHFDRTKVPLGDRAITAWAFDSEKAVLYPLRTQQIVH